MLVRKNNITSVNRFLLCLLSAYLIFDYDLDERMMNYGSQDLVVFNYFITRHQDFWMTK